MQKDLYNKKRLFPAFWQHDYHVLTRLRRAILQSVGSKTFPGNATAVDYGCGTSPYASSIERIVPHFIRVDIGKNPHADVLVGEHDRLPLASRSADLVVSTQVLEHVRDVDFYLNECRRILKPHGVLILSTHGIWPFHPFPEDYARWTRSGLCSCVSRHGFTVTDVIPILGPFASVTQFSLVLLAQYFSRLSFPGRVALCCVSCIGNALLWCEDTLFPPTRTSDAAVFVLCAEKT